ncbi:synaptogenesis protein syg-2-like isoform X9 [Neodiprion virginianus]|uniref:synaptogenesis protein syg-2-like isoform X9 n=1 Tax=Neodiprion virginianus TaxID=2961670 RepID=UPI001EE09A98|nr:synaptogenesis protein syg-2-like isoform X8 [Neodiprion pinetum]XP_046627904.1 synaptogenesis protein syg-2-like isoform X9 [Neodiprion virginianus]
MGGRGADRVGTPLFVAVSTIAFLVALRPCHATITNQEIVAMSEAQAVAGGVAQLPCDVEPPINGDRLYLVIWYKEESNNPIYSFDCRGHGNVQHATHWSDSSIGNRAFFKQSDKPAKLNLESVTEKDNGLYRCRVDFKQSPTRNSKVNLTVIIPPERLSILDEDGIAHIQNYILGPYSEGASVNITCVATGGRPQPRVTWWDESVLLDESFEAVGNRSVRNVLRLEKLERKHLSTTLTCQASNNNMVTPIVGTVTLNMNLKPLWVRLQGENRPLSAGTTYEIECEVVGARPTPDVIWSKGNIPLKNTRLTVSPDGNTTTSTLTFVPSIEDAGKFLSCKGSVPSIPHSTIEDGWKLDIHHTPVVTLELGSNLNGSPIREGIDVYFECNIKSNPWVYKVSWRHNGNPLYHNAAAGTIVSNQSLVLQSVTRSRTGIYTCVGSNREGDGESNALNLDIKFAPVCRPGQTKVYGVARQETVRIRCELEANPANVSFTWRFNSSAEAVDIAQAHVTSDRAQSVVSYTPMTESDYGSLVCLGVNDQGAQLEPCVYTIVPAALTPVMLSLSGPLLGAVVGAAAGLLLVIFVIVLAVRLRYRPRPQDDKDSHDDGGMANLAAPNEKTSSLPANADSIESFEKNPDIIPHANENSYAELCKGASPRFILPQSRQLQDQSSFGPNGNNVSCYRDITGASPARVRQKDVKKCLTNASTPLMPQSIELTYAELSLQRGGRRVPPNCYQPVPVAGVQRPQLLPMSTLTRRQQPQDPTIYAQVATGKSVYIPPPHPYLTRGVDETTAETPLIGRENKLHQIYSYRSKKPSYIPRDGSKALIQRIKNLLIRTEITTPKFPPLGRRIIIVSQ